MNVFKWNDADYCVMDNVPNEEKVLKCVANELTHTDGKSKGFDKAVLDPALFEKELDSVHGIGSATKSKLEGNFPKVKETAKY